MHDMFPAVAVRLYSISVGLLLIVLRPLGLVARGVRRWELGARMARPAVPAQAQGLQHVWLHAASLGECRLLCRLADILQRVHPGARFVATAVTRTGVRCLRERCPPSVHVAGYLPADTRGCMRRFLRAYQVARVWVVETELWPSMLWECGRRGIAVGVFNGRLEKSSMRRYLSVPWLARAIVRPLDPVLVQDECYAERFRRIGVAPERVKVMGNHKAQVNVAPLPHEERERLRGRWGLRPNDTVITAGCVHPGEGAVLAQARAELARAGIEARLVAVLRHGEALHEVAAELGEGTVVLDGESAAQGGWHTAVVARYGVLDELYGMADIAFVGGTFVDVGGHSMWEPAQYGVPVLFGPVHHTQQNSCEQLLAAGVGFEVADAAAFAARAARLLGSDAAVFARAREHFAQSLADSQDTLLRLVA